MTSNLNSGNTAQQVGIRGDSFQEALHVARRLGRGESVVWTPGAGGRLRPVLSGVVSEAEVTLWQEGAKGLGVELGEFIAGDFIRVFRQKGFQRADAEFFAGLWAPEKALLGNGIDAHGRFDSDPIVIDDAVRTAASGHAGLTWVGLPEKAKALACDWQTPSTRLDAGALQVTFHHTTPVGVGLRETFVGPMAREANEKTPQRHVWGFFKSDGLESHFTVFLTEAEMADNHQIAKKFRRLKQALNKMFMGPEWLGPQAVQKPTLEFTDLLKDEMFKLIPDVPAPFVAAHGTHVSGEVPVGLPKHTHGSTQAEVPEAHALQT